MENQDEHDEFCKTPHTAHSRSLAQAMRDLVSSRDDPSFSIIEVLFTIKEFNYERKSFDELCKWFRKALYSVLSNAHIVYDSYVYFEWSETGRLHAHSLIAGLNLHYPFNRAHLTGATRHIGKIWIRDVTGNPKVNLDCRSAYISKDLEKSPYSRIGTGEFDEFKPVMLRKYLMHCSSRIGYVSNGLWESYDNDPSYDGYRYMAHYFGRL